MDVLHDMLRGVDYGDFRAKAWQLLPAVSNHVLGLEESPETVLKQAESLSAEWVAA